MIGMPYEADITKVKTIIQDTLTKNEKIMISPAPAIMLKQFGDRALDLKILFWVYDLSDAGSIRSNAMIEIYQKLTDAGIHLPVYKGPLAEPGTQQPSIEEKNFE